MRTPAIFAIACTASLLTLHSNTAHALLIGFDFDFDTPDLVGQGFIEFDAEVGTGENVTSFEMSGTMLGYNFVFSGPTQFSDVGAYEVVAGELIISSTLVGKAQHSIKPVYTRQRTLEGCGSNFGF